MKRLLTTVFVLMLLGMSAAAFLVLRDPDSGPGPAPLAVAEMRDFTPRITATGSIRLVPGARVEVGAQVSGVVRRLAVQQGSRVRKGDLIAKIDDREARARLVEAEAGVRQLLVDSAQAEADLERFEQLGRSQVITVQELETARSTFGRVVARLDAARATRDLARINLDNTEVRAPISGVVAAISTKEGETVASTFAAPTFVTIVDPEPARLECVAFVDETDIGRVRPGQPVEFTVDAYPGKFFTGTVERIAPDATIISGVVDYEVTVRVTDAAGLKPQMTASVMIATESRSALVVPSAAVRQGAQELYVWKIEGGRPRRIVIQAGARQLDATEVTAGLNAGDTVLTGNFPQTTER